MISFDQEVFQDWIAPMLDQISKMQLDIICLVPEEIKVKVLCHVEFGWLCRVSLLAGSRLSIHGTLNRITWRQESFTIFSVFIYS